MIIHKNFSLSQAVWYKIGGKARYLIDAENIEDIYRALDFVEKNKVQKVFFCGLGSNLIFSDDFFDGAVIRIVKSEISEKEFNLTDRRVSVFSGVTIDSLIKFAFANNLTGVEWAGGLPGTVGAGIRGNAGAFGHEIQDSIYSADVLERRSGGYSLKTLYKKDLEFEYRSSLVKKNREMIIISAVFELKTSDEKETEHAKRVYADNINYRKEHHPVEYPTCGSVFKNIIEGENIEKIISVWPDIKELKDNKWHGKIPMGYVIKRLGFEGYRVGSMQVSTKHANFIVNLGGGRGKDVIFIIQEIQRRVKEEFDFVPQTEAEIVRI